MAVETTEKFTCDTTRCRKSAEDRNEVMHVTVTYRMTDGSSGTEEHQFCGNHEGKVIEALRDAGVVVNDPLTPPPPEPIPAGLSQDEIDANAEQANATARKTTAKGR